MTEWEYLSIAIQSREVTRGEWMWTLADEPDVRGMHNILNYYGAKGFELVDVSPEYWRPVSSELSGVVQYRAFFRRHKQSSTDSSGLSDQN